MDFNLKINEYQIANIALFTGAVLLTWSQILGGLVIPYNMSYSGRSSIQKTFFGDRNYFCIYKNDTVMCKREIIELNNGNTETTINLECSERAGEIELNKI